MYFLLNMGWLPILRTFSYHLDLVLFLVCDTVSYLAYFGYNNILETNLRPFVCSFCNCRSILIALLFIGALNMNVFLYTVGSRSIFDDSLKAL